MGRYISVLICPNPFLCISIEARADNNTITTQRHGLNLPSNENNQHLCQRCSSNCRVSTRSRNRLINKKRFGGGTEQEAGPRSHQHKSNESTTTIITTAVRRAEKEHKGCLSHESAATSHVERLCAHLQTSVYGYAPPRGREGLRHLSNSLRG